MQIQKIQPEIGSVTINPATGESIKTYLYDTPCDVGAILAANAAAAKQWRAFSMEQRTRCYQTLAGQF